jgi:hypothetical protein
MAKQTSQQSVKQLPVPAQKSTRRAEATQPYHIFLSYSSKSVAETIIAKSLRDQMMKLGAKVFLDEAELQGGDKLSDVLRAALRRCDELVLLFSPNSSSSPWVHLEVGAGWLRNRRITPILLDIGTGPGEHWKMGWLNEYQYYDINEFADKFLPELALRVNPNANKNVTRKPSDV